MLHWDNGEKLVNEKLVLQNEYLIVVHLKAQQFYTDLDLYQQC